MDGGSSAPARSTLNSRSSCLTPARAKRSALSFCNLSMICSTLLSTMATLPSLYVPGRRSPAPAPARRELVSFMYGRLGTSACANNARALHGALRKRKHQGFASGVYSARHVQPAACARLYETGFSADRLGSPRQPASTGLSRAAASPPSYLP